MDFDHGEAGGELVALQKRITELENQNDKLKHVVKENDLQDEFPPPGRVQPRPIVERRLPSADSEL